MFFSIFMLVNLFCRSQAAWRILNTLLCLFSLGRLWLSTETRARADNKSFSPVSENSGGSNETADITFFDSLASGRLNLNPEGWLSTPPLPDTPLRLDTMS
jgi:hypothetical protein